MLGNGERLVPGNEAEATRAGKQGEERRGLGKAGLGRETRCRVRIQPQEETLAICLTRQDSRQHHTHRDRYWG